MYVGPLRGKDLKSLEECFWMDWRKKLGKKQRFSPVEYIPEMMYYWLIRKIVYKQMKGFLR